MVPVKETIDRLRQIFPKDIVSLYEHVLTTTYFQINNTFYEQIDGVAMGSPLSPVVANYYMESFEETALETAPQKPSHWFRYVDDTFVVWSHGEKELEIFLRHLNSIHPRIQFTMEKEANGKLPFLDVLVSRKENGSLGHQVFRKPTHTDRYLHKDSNHHHGQKRAMMKILVDRAKRVCEPSQLQAELNHLDQALQCNGYTISEIKRATNIKRGNGNTDRVDTNPERSRAFLPYLKNVTDRISKILKKKNVKTVFKPTSQLRNIIRSVKDPRDPLSSGGVYRIPCSCGSVYIGTTKRSVNTRIKEHKGNCRRGETEKSAVAEHAWSGGNHDIRFSDTKVLSSGNHYHSRLNREAIEIYKHPNNFNKKEENLRLRNIWYPALRENRETVKNNTKGNG